MNSPSRFKRFLLALKDQSSKALIGIIAAAAGLGVAHLIASFYNPGASPIIAVGSSAIDLAPLPLKNFAIDTFGEYDKIVLVGSVMAGLVFLTGGLGILAFRSLKLALAGILVLGVVGGIAALSRGDAGPLSVLPALATVVVGGYLLTVLVAAFKPRWEPTAADGASDDDTTRDPPTPDDAVHDDAIHDDVIPAKAGATPIELDTRTDPSEREPVMSTTRRGLLIGGSAGLALAAAGGGQLVNTLTSSDSALGRNQKLPEAVSKATALPAGAQPNVKGITPFVTNNDDFYRVDISINTPRLSTDDWTLEIGGMVDNPVTLTYADLLDMDLIERWVTISCVSNPVGGPYVGNAKWLGVKMADLADQIGIKSGADQWLSTSSDGYTCGTPLKTMLDGRDSMLAVGMNGEQLPVAHGFPARQLVPGLFGFVSATKWVVKMEATTYKQTKAYWTERDWATEAPTLTAARVDVPKGFATVPAGKVTIAGVAWAQHRGVAKVEVSIDDAPFKEAKLAADAGKDVWREWTFDWQSTGKGRHDIKVRATDLTGKTQVEKTSPVFPKGATGWPSVSFNVS